MFLCKAFFTLLALSWLGYRLYKFITIPVVKIVSTLGIGTPPATKVSIDRVSQESITVHWENEPVKNGKRRSNAISHFLLYVNNLQVAIFPNAPNSLYTCCSITGLESGHEYQLDFVTVNSMGFINKLPSLYCMTKRAGSLGGSGGRVSGKWRRNTLSVSAAALPDAAAAQPGTFASPAYANLTSLKDLEAFSIDDLKKILVCAQEDLHDVLSQQASLLQDFQESKLQLELELDNLKNYWSHEINLRKSLRSNIKSLENSKLLSDLKLDKINKNIDQTTAKIGKMQKDIARWSQQDEQQMGRAKLREKFDTDLAKVNEEIDSLSETVKSCQREISAQEERNKELNSLKKSSTSQSSLDQQDGLLAPTALLKKLNDATVEKSGLLNASGDEFIAKLNQNSPVVKCVRDQLKVDQELDVKWRSRRNKMAKRIDTLEAMLNDISVTNRQLRTNLIIHPYTAKQSEQNSLSNSPAESRSNSNSNLNHQSNGNSSSNLNEKGVVMNSPPVSNISVMDNINQQGVPMSTSHSLSNGDTNLHLALHNPSTYASNKPTQATESVLSMQMKNDKLYSKPFQRGSTDPATLMPSGYMSQSFPWGSEQQQQHHTEIEQAFEYDNASHLISGLQDMIYDETDYPESISNYSKGFTTDQLDNYWTNQRLTTNNGTGPTQPVNFATPRFNNDGYSSLSPFGGNSEPRSPSPPNLAPNQSLLAATLSDPSMANFGDGMLSMKHSNSFHAMDNGVSSSLPGPHGVIIQTPTSRNESPQPMSLGEEAQFPESHHHSIHDTHDRLHAPRFNFMWQQQQSHSATPKEENGSNHVRNGSMASSGSNNSTWSKLNWKNWSPQAPTQPENDNVPQSPPPLPRSSSHNQKAPASPASSSGRRMSRLLSRSGMNNIFKLPSHDEKK